MPNWFPGGYGYDRINRARQGLHDGQGRELTLGQQALSVLGGVKIIEFNIRELAVKKRKRLSYLINEMNGRIKKNAKKYRTKQIKRDVFLSERDALKEDRDKLVQERRRVKW